MSLDQKLVLAILAGSMVLFVARVRVDLVALLVVLALMLTGVTTPAEAVAGFGSTVVVMIASLLVVGEALARTGVADVVGGWISRFGKGGEGRTRTAVVVASGVLGSVMSSTAVVALFLPVVMRVAQEHRLHPGRILMPLAYGALVSGMMTLIGTAPNLVVHAELRARGYEGFGFFEFTPIGVSVLLCVVLCFALGARWMLPAPPEGGLPPRRPRMRDLWRQFVPESDLLRMRLAPGAPWIGQSLRETELGTRHGMRVLAVEREDRRSLRRPVNLEAGKDLRLQSGDVLTLAGPSERVQALGQEHALEVKPLTMRELARLDQDLGVAVVMIHPESELVGKTLVQASFRTRQNMHAVGLRRDGEAVPGFTEVALKPADSLLVMGRWSRIAKLQEEYRDFVLLTAPTELSTRAPAQRRMPIALAILFSMVVASAFGVLPVMTSALLAAVLLVLTRCIRMADAYRGIHWGSLVLIAGMLSLAEALGREGVVAMAVEGMTTTLAGTGPRVALAVVFLVTAALGSVVSNTATAVLMAPIAIGLAEALGLRPEAFAMTVAIAASAAYLTPMASPVVSLVVEPGKYDLSHFLRAGLPVSLATLAVCVYLTPLLLPF